MDCDHARWEWRGSCHFGMLYCPDCDAEVQMSAALMGVSRMREIEQRLERVEHWLKTFDPLEKG